MKSTPVDENPKSAPVDEIVTTPHGSIEDEMSQLPSVPSRATDASSSIAKQQRIYIRIAFGDYVDERFLERFDHSTAILFPVSDVIVAYRKDRYMSGTIGSQRWLSR